MKTRIEYYVQLRSPDTCWGRLEYTYESGRRLASSLYLVPVSPGYTRAIGKFVFKAAPGHTKRPLTWLYNLLQWLMASIGLLHALGHQIMDQVRCQVQHAVLQAMC